MERNSDYYYKEAKKYNQKTKEALKSNDKKMSVFYKNKVKEYLDLYNTKIIQEKQLEQKKEEEEKLEKQLDVLEKENRTIEEQKILEKEEQTKLLEELERELQIKKNEEERLEQENMVKERLEQERLEQEKMVKERLEQEMLVKERLEQERLDKERLNKIKYKQQRKNLRKREKTYKKRTGHVFNPLVTDDEDNNTNNIFSPTPQDITPLSTLNPSPITQQISLPTNSKSNKKTRKKIKIPKSPPVYEGIEMTDFSKTKMNITKKINKLVGFTETLKKTNANVEQKTKPLPNSTICQNIFINGSKTNNKYFYPSEFPKLTKIKPISILTKKGGRNYKRKTFKKRYKK